MLYDPRITSKSMHPWASEEIFPGDNVEILLMLFRLLAMHCKCTFTKHFTFSTPQICAGWTSNLIFCLKCFLHFGYQICLFFSINCLISIFEYFLQTSYHLRTVNDQKIWAQKRSQNQAQEVMPARNKLAKIFTGTLHQFSTVRKTTVTDNVIGWSLPNKIIGCATAWAVKKQER